ncbi:MAG: uracil-DNA glycosylase [Geminicoccaceae bacterium]
MRRSEDGTDAEPDPTCGLCPRLVAYRGANRETHPDWHNAPVPSFGPQGARLLIVGLAPGVSGANRTGRPFTGDFAGDILYAALFRHGFAQGSYDRRRDDSLQLLDCRVTNAVRCVPPENKPVGREITTCRGFLTGQLTQAPAPRVVLTLGAIAHGSTIRALGERLARCPFGHDVFYELAKGPTVVASYHTSRYNLNTGRLTEAMFETVVARVRRLVDRA